MNRSSVLGIQYLRGLAALMVVLQHSRNPQPWLFDPLVSYGNLARGVDIFFVISGFIMFTAARNEAPLDFAKRRAIRIAPLYWIVTAIAVVTATMHRFVPVEDVARSLLFIPFHNAAEHGRIWPILVPGWSLNYEMFFYALFMVALWAKRPLMVLPLLLALVAAGAFIHPDNALASTYTNPILLEFACGIIIGAVYRNHEFRHLWPLLLLGLAGLLIGVDLPLGLGATACAAAVVIGTLSLEPLVQRHPLASAKLVGDASYATYLFHIPVLSTIYIVFKRVPLHGYPQFLAVVLTAAVASALAGIVLHLWLEKPMTVRLLNWRPTRRETQSPIRAA